MSSSGAYSLETLQQFDEECRTRAEALGLTIPEVLYHLVQAEEMYDIASRHLPGRRSHYHFGREYEQMKSDYDKGRSRIYELVINTDPVHAYLLDGNGLVAQLLVIAHVYGHAAVYEHSKYFEPADKNILQRTRGAADRIDGYIGEYGRTRVENFVDACEALQYQRSFAQLGKPWTAKEPEWRDTKYDRLFPQETAERKEEFVRLKEEFRARFPKQPEQDVLAFLEEHARRLEDWQKDVISIIRMEMDYFAPMMFTQVLHEATAVYYHRTIVMDMMAEDRDTFSDEDYLEFESMNAGVLGPKLAMSQDEDGNPLVNCAGINPYLTGQCIYQEIKRLCEEPTDEDKERHPWAGEATWDEYRNEVIIPTYNDGTLLAEFLTPRVCEKAKLFMEPRTPEEYKNLRITKEEAEKTRDVLVRTKFALSPAIYIVDADYNNRGELYLEHDYHGNGIMDGEDLGLDYEYTMGTMPHLGELWGHPVVLKTLSPKEEDENLPSVECYYRYDGKETTRDTKEPE